VDPIPHARTQRIAETLLPRGTSSQVRGYGGTDRWDDRERVERCHLQRRHRHGDGDERSVDASFRCLRREARLCAGGGPPRQTKSRRRDRLVQANLERHAIGVKKKIMIVILFFNIVKTQENEHVYLNLSRFQSTSLRRIIFIRDVERSNLM